MLQNIKVNDFTKEELMQIMYDMDMNGQRYSDSFTMEQYKALDKKIQSMIDNYCAIKLPTVDNYVCPQCNEEWIRCECKAE